MKLENFRRNWWRTSGEVWKEIFELLLLGKIVRRIFHQNSSANFTIKLTRFWVVAGPTYSWFFQKTSTSAKLRGGAPERGKNRGPLNRGVSNGGVSQSGLVLPFLSFLGLSRFFRDFPDLSGDSSGIFPICPFPLPRPINSAYEEQSRKGPATQSGPFPKKVGNPPVWNSPGLASPKRRRPVAIFRNARLFIILFVRNFRRVCSQFWLSVRNSV